MSSEETRAAFVARHNARTDYRHPIVMPNASRWSDLFARTAPRDVRIGPKGKMAPEPFEPPTIDGPDWRNGKVRRTVRMPVGPSLTFNGKDPHAGYGFASVYANLDTVNAIAANTIVIERDSMYFKVIEWAPEADGTRLCLVVCDHSQIIGGVWVAVIDVNEVPEWLRFQGKGKEVAK